MSSPKADEETGGAPQGRIPVRYLLPNFVTLLSLCSGVTAIRLAIEGRYELAVTAVIVCIVLDAVDGRLARYLKSTSRFGAELDSLADFVNFGVTPALLIYLWSLNELKTKGWLVCLMFAVCCAMRLARFNVALDDLKKPSWAGRFFTGVPAPAGAGLAMTPMYLGFLGIIDNGHKFALMIAPFVAIVALLMVSRIPTFSGKSGNRVRREHVLPIVGLGVGFLVCLFTYPWETLSISALLYLVMIIFSIRSYRRYRSMPDQT